MLFTAYLQRGHTWTIYKIPYILNHNAYCLNNYRKTAIIYFSLAYMHRTKTPKRKTVCRSWCKLKWYQVETTYNLNYPCRLNVIVRSNFLGSSNHYPDTTVNVISHHVLISLFLINVFVIRFTISVRTKMIYFKYILNKVNCDILKCYMNGK